MEIMNSTVCKPKTRKLLNYYIIESENNDSLFTVIFFNLESLFCTDLH